MSLIGVEGGNATRISRFANYLRNLLPSSDPVVMEMASKAMGHLSMAGDTFTAEYVEFEVKRALEWLGADRNEGRRHAAVGEKRWINLILNVLLMVLTSCIQFYNYSVVFNRLINVFIRMTVCGSFYLYRCVSLEDFHLGLFHDIL